MKKLHKILNEITELTKVIETNYPELYKFLDENPTTISSSEYPDISNKALQDYLESLKELLKHHIETHKSSC